MEKVGVNLEHSIPHIRIEDEEMEPSIATIYPNEVEIMQSTGLKDKNGKEIFCGDVLSMFGGSQKSSVFWDKEGGHWAATAQISGCADIEDHLLCNLLNTGEIIGNIYENPELLK